MSARAEETDTKYGNSEFFLDLYHTQILSILNTYKTNRISGTLAAILQRDLIIFGRNKQRSWQVILVDNRTLKRQKSRKSWRTVFFLKPQEVK